MYTHQQQKQRGKQANIGEKMLFIHAISLMAYPLPARHNHTCWYVIVIRLNTPIICLATAVLPKAQQVAHDAEWYA